MFTSHHAFVNVLLLYILYDTELELDSDLKRKFHATQPSILLSSPELHQIQLSWLGEIKDVAADEL